MSHPHSFLPPAAASAGARFFRASRGVVLLGLALGTAGCYARGSARAAVVYSEPVQDEPVVVVVQTVPAEIESYPQHHYRGTYVYLVDGRWYGRSSGRWVVYRREPRELASVRVRYESRYGHHYRPRNDHASPPRRDRRDRN